MPVAQEPCAAASKRCLAAAIPERFCRAQRARLLTGSSNECPSLVSSYSTRGGMVGKTVRVTRPSRSRHRSVKVSIRCEMLPSARRSSLNRLGPSPSVLTTSTVHLSPTRASTSLTARQSSGTCRLLGISDVPSCRRRLGIYLALVSNRNQGRPLMAKVKVAVIVSTTRAARFGHKPAQWIADIASQRDDMVVEVLDLREYPMPFFDEVASNAWVPSQN